MKHRRRSISAICTLNAIILFGGLCFVYAEEALKTLRITPEQFDFGTIEEGKAAIATAVVHNIGTTRIEITNVRTN
jgi:hypothetical protein